MALHGSGGAYYRSNATLSAGLPSAYTRHVMVKGATAPSAANYRVPAAMLGAGQNPQNSFNWNHMSASFDRAHQHRAASGAYATARYASSLSTNQWLSIGLTYDGTTLVPYLDGVAGATAAIDPSANNAVYLDLLGLMTFDGALEVSSNWTDGEVAEYAYWNVALTADEMASLGKGFRPDRIRPQALQFYSPCVRGLQDIRGGRTLVKQAGTDVPSDHPRVF